MRRIVQLHMTALRCLLVGAEPGGRLTPTAFCKARCDLISHEAAAHVRCVATTFIRNDAFDHTCEWHEIELFIIHPRAYTSLIKSGLVLVVGGWAFDCVGFGQAGA